MEPLCSLYTSFRNPAESGRAISQALKIGYKPLYDANEYAHELSDKDLKGAIIQVTGLAEDSKVAGLILSTFKNLKQFASFDLEPIEKEQQPRDLTGKQSKRDLLENENADQLGKLKFSYTINLNLPATSDISVFNAIFRSLKENILKNEK